MEYYPTSKIILRSNPPRKDGTQTVNLRITINRKYKNYKLGITVLPENWNAESDTQKVKKADLEHKSKNKIIAHCLKNAREIITNSIVNDKQLTFSEFEQLFAKSDTQKQSFFDFMNSLIDTEISKTLSEGTAGNYRSQTSKIKKFRNELNFNEIDTTFIRTYEAYMYSELSNKKSTANKSLIWLKNVMNKAIEKGIIKENPFVVGKIKLQRIKGNRIALTLQEVDKLNELFQQNVLSKGKQNVLRYFLFACYTGIRVGDLSVLKFSDIKQFDGKEFISIIMHKTNEPVNIPLVNKAKELIIKKRIANDTVFDVLTDQPANRYLKEIMKMVHIDKSISFHCSRHTFATVGFNRLGIPIEVISKILGHTDIKTTMIYCAIDNEKLSNEANKWDSF